MNTGKYCYGAEPTRPNEKSMYCTALHSTVYVNSVVLMATRIKAAYQRDGKTQLYALTRVIRNAMEACASTHK